jgi:hypothetical protein
MIKCPHCGMRVLGQDLLNGTCSQCNQRLTNQGDSSIVGDSQEFFAAQVKDSSRSSGSEVKSDSSGESAVSDGTSGCADAELSNEMTYISEEFVSHEDDRESGISSIADSQSSAADGQSDADSDQSASGDVGGRTSSHDADEIQKTAANCDSSEVEGESVEIAATYISNDVPEEILDTEDNLDANGDDATDEGDLKTIISDDEMGTIAKSDEDELHLKTFVVEALHSNVEGTDADQTYVSDDIPRQVLKTIESLWGSLEEAQPSRQGKNTVPIGLKGDSKKKAEQQNPQQQTLVIKTKSFSDTVSGSQAGPRSKGDEPRRRGDGDRLRRSPNVDRPKRRRQNAEGQIGIKSEAASQIPGGSRGDRGIGPSQHRADL